MLEKLESKQDTIRRMQKNFKDNLIETDSKHPLMERAGLLLEEVLATWNEINTLYQVCNILLEIFDCNDNWWSYRCYARTRNTKKWFQKIYIDKVEIEVEFDKSLFVF